MLKKIKPLLAKLKIKNQQLSVNQLIFILILLSAIFLRFYNLAGSLMFQGDQGRDALIVARIFRQADPVFIGPVTSVGNMYLGPLYYYFMLPFLFLTYPSPMGPVYAIAGLGVLTVYLIYRFGSEMFDQRTGLIASFFYTFSAVITTYSRFSWNPNPAPLISLLMIYFTYRALNKEKYWFLVILCFAILLQLHYLSILTAASAGLVWLYQLISLVLKLNKNKAINKASKKPVLSLIKTQLLASLLGLIILLASFTPLILFDLKHDFLNIKAFQKIFTDEKNFAQVNTSVFSSLVTIIQESEGRSMHILFEYNIGKNRQLNQYLTYFVYLSLLILLLKKIYQKNKKETQALAVILIYFIVSVFGTAAYQHSVFNHYIAYLFPVTAIIYALILGKISRYRPGILILIIFTGFFLSYNLPKMPLKSNNSLITTQKTTELILSKMNEGEKYNLVLLSESKDIDGQNYRYFLTASSKPPVENENRGNIETLVIIDEEQKADNILALPIYEIVVFPDKDHGETFQVENGPQVTILRKQ